MSEQREDQSEKPSEAPGSDARAVEPVAGPSSEPPASSSGGEESATESERQDGAKTVQLRGPGMLGAVRGPPRPGGSSRPEPPKVSPEGDSLVDLVAEPVRDEATELDWGEGEEDEPETATADRRIVDVARARAAALSRDDASQTLDLDALGAAEGAEGIDDPSTFDTSAANPLAAARALGTPHPFGLGGGPSPLAPSATPSPASAGPGPRGATTHQLHTEDEDGPTMVAFPSSAPDDEATQVHTAPAGLAPIPMGLPVRPLAAPAHGALGEARPLPPPSERTANLPHPLAAAPVQPPAAPVAAPLVAPPMVGVQAALREAAVQAALAAATSAEDSPEAIALRAQRLETLITVLLGVGLVVGALGSYLSVAAVADAEAARGAAYGGTSLVASFALFGCGLAALQRRPATKLGLVIVSAALLVFALARVLVVAAS